MSCKNCYRLTDTILAKQAQNDAMYADLREAQSTIDRLKAALTPSPNTKAAYMGEFQFSFPELDKNGEEVLRNINVPWTVTKIIMAAIRKQAGLEVKP